MDFIYLIFYACLRLRFLDEDSDACRSELVRVLRRVPKSFFIIDLIEKYVK